VKHLLVTNDFPPKVGGIQSYLWELWRRLPPDEVTVLTTPYAGSEAFDAAQPFRIVRTLGLELPGVEESTMYGAPALKVRGTLLACMASHKSAEPGSLVVRIGFDRMSVNSAAPRCP